MGEDEKLDPGSDESEKGEALDGLPFLMANGYENPRTLRVYEPLREGGR